MYYVYVLFSKKTKKLYKGYTVDLKKRLIEHSRKQVKSTMSGVPWKLLYYECFVSKEDARKEELFLKTGKGRDRIKYLLENTIEHIEEG